VVPRLPRSRIASYYHCVNQKRKTVLVVESEPDLRQLIIDFLEFDYTAVGVGNANDGVEAAWGWRPDLILCDCHLPGRSGLWLIEAVRQYPNLAEIPIILMSEQPQPGVEALYGVSVVSKPCPVDQIMEAVHGALEAVPA
jgi:two-component system OmpR family response regulator